MATTLPWQQSVVAMETSSLTLSGHDEVVDIVRRDDKRTGVEPPLRTENIIIFKMRLKKVKNTTH